MLWRIWGQGWRRIRPSVRRAPAECRLKQTACARCHAPHRARPEACDSAWLSLSCEHGQLRLPPDHPSNDGLMHLQLLQLLPYRNARPALPFPMLARESCLCRRVLPATAVLPGNSRVHVHGELAVRCRRTFPGADQAASGDDHAPVQPYRRTVGLCRGTHREALRHRFGRCGRRLPQTRWRARAVPALTDL